VDGASGPAAVGAADGVTNRAMKRRALPRTIGPAALLGLAVLACSAPDAKRARASAAATGRTDAAMPRPDRLWPLDLSDEAVEARSLDELWSIGVELLNWPAAMPEGTDKASVVHALREARLHDVEDTIFPGYGGR